MSGTTTRVRVLIVGKHSCVHLLATVTVYNLCVSLLPILATTCEAKSLLKSISLIHLVIDFVYTRTIHDNHPCCYTLTPYPHILHDTTLKQQNRDFHIYNQSINHLFTMTMHSFYYYHSFLFLFFSLALLLRTPLYRPQRLFDVLCRRCAARASRE